MLSSLSEVNVWNCYLDHLIGQMSIIYVQYFKLYEYKENIRFHTISLYLWGL